MAPSPLVLVDTTARVNRMHILSDMHRVRHIHCNTKQGTFQPHQPRILFPETYLRLAHLYNDCVGISAVDIHFEAKTYDTEVISEKHHGPLGVLCLAQDGIDAVCVTTCGTTLHIAPGIMLVLRSTANAELTVLKRSNWGSASMMFVAQKE